MDPKRSSPLRAVFKIDSISVAARITGLYLLSGFLWILFSDRLLLLVTQDARQLSELQTYKGWFYVFITAGFLFLLVRHYFRIIEEGKEEDVIYELGRALDCYRECRSLFRRLGNRRFFGRLNRVRGDALRERADRLLDLVARHDVEAVFSGQSS